MSKSVIGWDIGGAHVKAVLLNAEGHIVQVSQQACALWKGLHLLESALQTILQTWAIEADQCLHAVTMTGELVDLFENRAQGVREIAQAVKKQLPQAMFYMAGMDQAALFTETVDGLESYIASMNWHASAQCLAEASDASCMLIVDIGSTTSDITLCHAKKVIANGWTDAERMERHGLLYSGVVRTPLMAFGPYIAWHRQTRHITAEYFATTADVYRVLGELDPEHDLADTADGQGRSVPASMRRLARMVGHDLEDAETNDWHSLAQAFKDQQLSSLLHAIQSCIEQATLQPQALTGLGAGSFLLPEIAQRLNLTYTPASTWMSAGNSTLKSHAEVCFPAYAVARLWQAWH
ncbi:MAG: hydantoinase/oxoprolinase family protein [Methylophilus sp.]|uniref:hydantoinase/oxoprolinase family protein n=1 Tax=Methylophilus sp. TaxID=29541 RepID=UPI003F9F8315